MKTNKQNWKSVTIGGFNGILMGAGVMHVAQSLKAKVVGVESDEQAQQSLDDLSFHDAFDAARAQLGPGGIFSWHGNLYNTYTADEWQAMSDDDKDQFAEEVNPEISPEDIDTDEIAENESAQDEDTDVTVAEDATTNEPELATASEPSVESDDDDVRVVGFGEVQLANGQNVTVQELDYNGQRVAVIDLDQDGTPDVAMSDLNNNRQMDEGEVIDLHTAEALTFTNDEETLNDIPVDAFDA